MAIPSLRLVQSMSIALPSPGLGHCARQANAPAKQANESRVPSVDFHFEEIRRDTARSRSLFSRIPLRRRARARPRHGAHVAKVTASSSATLCGNGMKQATAKLSYGHYTEFTCNLSSLFLPELPSRSQARIQTAENLAAIARFQYFQS